MNDRLTLARENIKVRLKDFAAASSDAPGVNPTDCTKYDRVLDRIITR